MQLVKNIFLQKIFREILDFLLVFGGVFVVSMILLNFKELQFERYDYMQGNMLSEKTQELATVMKEVSVKKGNNDFQIMAMREGDAKKTIQIYDYNLDEFLHSKMDTYTLALNTFPPGDRIIIESLGVDAPIINIKYASEEKLKQADFNQELTMGVVKYPFTFDPGSKEKGSSLFFGHSSVDIREKDNPYGYVFRKLAKISDGAEINMIRKGKMYTYLVDNKEIVSPKEVDKTLGSYNDDSYVTLMSCYPLWTSKNRMLVRAKLVDQKQQIEKLVKVENGLDL